MFNEPQDAVPQQPQPQSQPWPLGGPDSGSYPPYDGYQQSWPGQPAQPGHQTGYQQPGYQQPGYPQAGYPQPGYVTNPYQQAPYPQPMVAPKSPGVAVLASFFLPGLGSMISGNGGIGALILILYMVSWLLTLVLIGFIGVFGFWVWGMFQAYSDAVSWNRRYGIIS